MAIINLTQKNFTKVLSEKIDKLGGAELLAAALIGGEDEMKKAISSVPDENLIWVNTDHVAAASAPIKIVETGDIVFRIYFDKPGRNGNFICIKGEDYKRFILTWAGEVKSINEGEYEVPSGYRAISIEDGCKVKVEKIEDCVHNGTDPTV